MIQAPAASGAFFVSLKQWVPTRQSAPLEKTNDPAIWLMQERNPQTGLGFDNRRSLIT
jgi:hypothetical protein